MIILTLLQSTQIAYNENSHLDELLNRLSLETRGH